ncbi:MAG: FKBP-type peptidyl-prolyl cis-trans isomerase [Pseudomonadota bacterium]
MSDQFVSKGKVVSFIYSIKDETGEIVEQSDLPISYVHGGKHDLFDKVEEAMEGCVVGDNAEVSLSPEEAFGAHDPSLTFTDDIENVPPEFHRVGAEVEMMNDAGDSRKFTVSRIESGKLTVDGNHPLAGKSITFNITITNIRDASPEELADGVPPMEMPVLH